MIRLAHPQINRIFEFDENCLNTLVVESATFFRSLAMDLIEQQKGKDGDIVLSKDYTPIKLQKNAEIITQFLPFDVNRKTLLAKVCSVMEHQAVNETFFVQTQELMATIERYLLDLSLTLPGEVYFQKISVEALIKSAGVQLVEEAENILDQILNYMEIVRELEGDKVFIFINMRSFFSMREMVPFVHSALGKKFMFMLMDSKEYELLPSEHRCLIDEDLCEV